MSATTLGYRLTCDGCGCCIDRDTSPTGDFTQVNAARRYAASLGWLCCTGRRVDGSVSTLDPNASRYRATGAAAVYDVCGDCAHTWEPPYLPSALAELAEASSGRSATEVSLTMARLISENARLREQLANP